MPTVAIGGTTLHVVSFGSEGSGEASCNTASPWASCESQIAYKVTNDTNLCQKIAATGQTVCEVSLFLAAPFVAGGGFQIEFWSDNARSGIQYGGTSNASASVPINATYIWYAVDWETNPTLPTGDAFMHVINVGGASRVGITSNTACYSDTNYDMHMNGSDIDCDLSMKICIRSKD